jgi:hypothetical protein
MMVETVMAALEAAGVAMLIGWPPLAVGVGAAAVGVLWRQRR